MYHDLQGVEV